MNVCCYSVKTPQFHQIHDHLYQIDLINTLNSSSHPQLYRKIRANFYQAITGPKIYKWFPVSFCGVLSEVNWVLCETQTKDSEKLFPGKYLLMQSLYTIHVCCINYYCVNNHSSQQLTRKTNQPLRVLKTGINSYNHLLIGN